MGSRAGLLTGVLWALRYLLVPVDAGTLWLDDVLYGITIFALAYIGVRTKRQDSNAAAGYAGFLAGMLWGLLLGIGTVFSPRYLAIAQQHPINLSVASRLGVILVDMIVTVFAGTIVSGLAALVTRRVPAPQERG